ncbi:HIT family protein [Planctomycetota bacterium]
MEPQADCIFCKIVAGEIPAARLYENDQVLSFLDIGPLSEGHALVIPKDHFVTVDVCPGKVLAHVASCLPAIARAVADATKCEGYNVLCNNGRAAGQLVDHLHFHIIPRTNGDALFSKWLAKEYAEGQMGKIAQRIRDQLKEI